MSPAQEAAAAYLANGWNVARLRPGEKAAVEGGWPNKRPGVADFLAGEKVGILLGEPSRNLIDVDIDDTAAARIVREWLPATGARFGRPSKPESHLIYRATGPAPENTKYVDPDGAVLGELRSTGLQTMAPPSLHPSGERVAWSSVEAPAEIGTPEIVEAVGEAFAAATLVRHWHEWRGQHHDLILSLAGAMLKAGKDRERVEAFVEAVCRHGGDDPAEIERDRLRGVQDTAAKIDAGDAANVSGLTNLTEIVGRKTGAALRKWLRLRQNDEPGDAELTDYGNGRRMVERFGDDLLFVRRGEGWHVWDGTRYAPDDTGRVEQMAKDIGLAVLEEGSAAALTNLNRSKALTKHGLKSLSAAGVRNTIESTRTEPETVATVADLDADPFLLNTVGGVVDLRTGGLSPHRREDLHTKVCPVAFDARATCPTWLKFLTRAMGGDAEKVAYLQRVIGYCLTGDTREQAVFLLHGSGGNGKSTLVELLIWLLGGYALKIPTETLMAKRGGSAIPNDVAQLPGARFVAANETSAGRRLNEALVKDLSGGDTITARFLHREFFQFRPTHKTIIYGNHKPIIHGTDEGIWRRLKLIEFGPRIGHPDKTLEGALRSEAPGILAWAVEGCTAWQRDGLQEPTSVTEATAEYRAEMDTIRGFLDACTEAGGKHKEKGSELYAAYAGWARENGEEAMTSTAFGNELNRHNVDKWKSNNAIWRRGLRLTAEGRAYTRLTIVMDDGQANPFAGPGAS